MQFDFEEFRWVLDEVHEVYTVSQALTADQKRIADDWADGPGTVTPPGHWNRIALDHARLAGWSTLRESQLFSALNTAQADAFIACWDAKHTYWTQRPVTAIRRLIPGASSWLSYIGTPPFPSYVSGHSSTSGAARRGLTQMTACALRSPTRRGRARARWRRCGTARPCRAGSGAAP